MTDYNNADLGTALDWDNTEVEDNGGFILLEPGKYPFVVTGLEKKRFEGSAKMAPCPQAEIKLCVSAGIQDTTITDRLMLSTKTQWRIARFFQCLGFPKNPETGRVGINWNDVEGRGGWVEIGIREYTDKNGNQRETNEIKTYILPQDAAAAEAEYNEHYAAPAQAAAPAPGYAPIPAAPTYQAPQQTYQAQMPMPAQAPTYQHPSMAQQY